MPSLTLRSPAKLNLFLRVLRKLPDGYHELETVFERISLCDTLTFSKAAGTGKIHITSTDPQVPCGPKNLIAKAARALQERCGPQPSVAVAMEKHIPVAAGLGGGSSNAATALVGLNRLWKLGLDRESLIGLAKQLGADVPFFLHDCAWGLGTGRGDLIRPLEIRAKLWHILVVPHTKMYSGEVFTRVKLELTKKGDNANILIHSLYDIDREDHISQYLRNDLESAILTIRPQLARVRSRLQAHGVTAAFSGSGPAVFGIVSSRSVAEQLRDRLSRYYRRVYAVQTL